MNKKRYNMCKKDFGPDGGGGDVEVHSKPRMMLVGTCGYMQNIIFIYHIYYYIIYIIYIYIYIIIYIYHHIYIYILKGYALCRRPLDTGGSCLPLCRKHEMNPKETRN